MRVALWDNSIVSSATTSSSGGFILKNVPRGTVDHLVVSDVSGKGHYLTTLQGNEVRTQDGKNIYPEEVFAVPRDKSLYRAINEELGATVEKNGLYVGIALKGGNTNAHPLGGVNIKISPAATVRYLKVNLDVEPTAKEAFFPSSAKATGSQGVFVAIAPPESKEYTISASMDGGKTVFAPLTIPLGKGTIAVGLHRHYDSSP